MPTAEKNMKTSSTMANSYIASRIKSVVSHMGLLATLVLYTVAGGMIFRALEMPSEISRVANAHYYLWSERLRFIDNVFNNSADTRNLRTIITLELERYETAIAEASSVGVTSVPPGYPGHYSESLAQDNARWSVLQSIFFASTVLTTIGYGNVAPITLPGRSFCVLFALIGIPLTLTVLTHMGKMMAKCVSALNRKLKGHLPFSNYWTRIDVSEKGNPRRRELQRILKPLSALAAIVLLLVYISAGACLFMLWEDWSFFEGFYFCFITMTTIGFGDIVPKDPEYMLICTFYILVGLAMTSTIVELVRKRYAQSWKHMKELTARLQGLSGPVTEALRKIELGKQSTLDLSVLQELRELKRTLALTRIETKIRFTKSIDKNSPQWAIEVEEALKEIVQDTTQTKNLKVVVYESSV